VQTTTLTQKEDYAIIVENISKKFKIPLEKKTTLIERITSGRQRYQELWALRNITFTVKKGETLGIIGENGSGKSTLLKIIAGVLQPDTGTVKVKGKIAPFLELGVGFQPELTAEDNVRLYGAIMGMTRNQIENKFEEIFKFAELEKFREMKLKNFSSGMYARLAFATAIATNPDILLIDEVLAVGDERFQKKCFEKMNEFRKLGKTILLVSHDLNSIMRMCKNAVLLKNGLCLKKGDVSFVVDAYYSNNNHISVDTTRDGRNVLKRRFGTGEVEIVDIKLLDKNGERTWEVKTGEKITLEVIICAKEDVLSPIVGMLVRDQGGFEVYNTNTFWQKRPIKKFVKNKRYVVRFVQDMSLSRGEYYFTVAAADSTGTRFYDWHDNALKIFVKDDGSFRGVTNLQANITINEYNGGEI